MDIFDPALRFEGERFLLRPLCENDLDDLFAVYSDKRALPYFNSDNCHGDNFYYPTRECMAGAFTFWRESFEKRQFVRLSVVDKASGRVVGTVELCRRVSSDAFNGMIILRVDVRSDYETEGALGELFALLTPLSKDDGLLTKAAPYAVNRIAAVKRAGFALSPDSLIGWDGRVYGDYWTRK